MLKIVVPHFRHQFFYDDPTHVRAITPMGLQLFSQEKNKICIEQGASNSPLGLYLDIDFKLKKTGLKTSQDWFRLHPNKNIDVKLLQQESNIYNNLIEQYDMELEVIKNIIDSFEFGALPKTTIKCEPNLGKRNLYFKTSALENYFNKRIALRKNLLAFSNGKNTMQKITVINR